jgi:hypothetical protein
MDARLTSILMTVGFSRVKKAVAHAPVILMGTHQPAASFCKSDPAEKTHVPITVGLQGIHRAISPPNTNDHVSRKELILRITECTRHGLNHVQETGLKSDTNGVSPKDKSNGLQ